jgi:hypothetical protein
VGEGRVRVVVRGVSVDEGEVGEVVVVVGLRREGVRLGSGEGLEGLRGSVWGLSFLVGGTGLVMGCGC